MAAARVALRYFPIVGRAQPLRHALADAGVAFEDLRVPMAEWAARKESSDFGGPYAGLPTLTWGEATVAETLPIASFLARRLGQYEGLDEVAVARLEAVSSNCYLEVMVRLGEILWADLIWFRVDLAGAFPRLLARVLDKVGRLDALLPDPGWLGGASPGVADFFAAESLEVLRHVLGPARDEALAARFPRLSALARAVRARPALAGAWEARPATFTARPREAAAVERLRAVDLSALGLSRQVPPMR